MVSRRSEKRRSSHLPAGGRFCGGKRLETRKDGIETVRRLLLVLLRSLLLFGQSLISSPEGAVSWEEFPCVCFPCILNNT